MDSTRESIGLLILRLGAGGLLLGGHGWPKLVHWAEYAAGFADPIGLGSQASFALVVFAEVPCALLVMLGLVTRLAVVPILGFLMIAAFVQHGHDSWADKEFALVYSLPFWALLCTGPGRFALDGRFGIRLGRKG